MNNINMFDQIVQLTVDRYNIKPQSLQFLAQETNVLYKLTDNNDKKFLIKIFQENSSTLEDNLLEVHVMNLINAKGRLSIPSILSSRDGKKIQEIETDKLNPNVRTVIYSWLEGDDLGGNENEERFVQLGEITALLHESTRGEVIPKNFTPKKWNQVFYFQGEKLLYKDEKYQRFLSKEYHVIMDKIIPYLNNRLSSYYQMNESNLQLIHGDLNPWNVIVDGKNMHMIDFEDVMLGLPLHDIAILLYYYKYEAGYDFKDVKRLFFKGYEKVRPLPKFDEFDLDLFMTARRINFMNYILVISEDPRDFIDMSLARVKEFLFKYKLNDT